MSPIVVFLLSLSSLAAGLSSPPGIPNDDTPTIAAPQTSEETTEPLPAAEETAEKEQPVTGPTAPTPEELATEAPELQTTTAFQTPAAAGNCQHLEPPACAIQVGGFTDNDVARACRDELQHYIENIRQYSTCRSDALREISSLTQDSMTEAQNTARRTTELFNCRLRGDTDCN